MEHPENVSPVNPIPPVVVAIFLAIVVIEVSFVLGSRGLVGGPGAIGWRLSALEQYSFRPEILRWMWENWTWPPEHLMRGVTYLFVHGNFTHAAVASVMLLAIGKMVGEAMSAVATLTVFLASGIVGALVYALVFEGPAVLFGSFPAVYGWIGAFTFLLWTRLGQVGANQARAFSLIGILIAIQLVFGLLFGGNSDWVADVAGFVTGFALTAVLVPGGWQRLRARIRHE